MSATGLAAFDSTIQTTHVWLNEICDELEWEHDAHRAYHALRVVLHALRDRLHPNEAAGLAAQLPLLIRGVFYEGWHPASTPTKAKTRDEFLAPVAEAFQGHHHVHPVKVARAVFRVLTRKLSAGEIEDIIRVLPPDLQALWD